MNHLKKGQCLCMKCGNVVSMYRSRFGDKGSPARYLAKPSLPISFSVSVFGTSVRAVDITYPEGYWADVQLKDPDFRGSFLESFKATLSWRRGDQMGTERNLEVNSDMRICPYCEGIEYLLPHAGEYDAYLIGELGRPGVGKTQFAKALASPRFKVKRDSFLGAGNSLSLLSGEDEGDLNMAAAPTQMDRRGVWTFLVKRRGAEPVLVYLMDIAGEFLLNAMSRQQDRAILKRILTNHCSAFFAFYDPREIASSQLEAYRAARRERDGGADDHLTDPLPLVHELFSGDMPPVAYILTGLDTLSEVSRAGGDGWLRVDGHRAFSANGTLAAGDSHACITVSSLRERMLLSRAAMYHLGVTYEDTEMSRNSGWFVISSGKVDLNSGSVDLDFAHGVVEPMAWFLSMAGIAEVKEA